MRTILGVLLAIPFSFSAANVFAAETDTLFLLYSFDEADGVVARDSGPLKADGTLSTLPETAVGDVSFTAGAADEAVPLLRNGAQVKSIKPKSERLMLDTEAPIIFDRDADYTIDYANGRVKPRGGGRMEPGKRVLVELTYSNSGPLRVAGRKGRALQFDGKDDTVDCGEPEALSQLSALTFDLWFQVPAEWNRSAVLVGKGDGLSLGFDDGKLTFRHVGLKTASGKPADATRSADAAPLKPGVWHHLRAIWADGAVEIQLDDKPVARTAGLAAGKLAAGGSLHIGGCVDPTFFAGLLDEVRIEFRN